MLVNPQSYTFDNNGKYSKYKIIQSLVYQNRSLECKHYTSASLSGLLMASLI